MNKKVLFTVAPAFLVMFSIVGCKNGNTTIDSITASCNKAFKVGDSINKSDVKVTATYSDKTTKDVSDWTCDTFKDDKYTFVVADKGEKEFTIKYSNKTTSLKVTVEENKPTVDKIEASLKEKKEYHVDDEITKNDIKVVATYSDASTKELQASDWTCSDFDSYGEYYFETQGEKILNIKHEGKTASLKITVGEIQTPYWSNYLQFYANSETQINVSKKEETPEFPASGEVKIPRYVRGKYIDHDESLVLEDEARYEINIVGMSAFTECEGNVTSVILPVSIIDIGQFAFYDTNIKSLHIPANTIRLGASMFDSCQYLTSITFEDINHRWFDLADASFWQPSSDGAANVTVVKQQGGSTKNEVEISGSTPEIKINETVTLSVETAKEDAIYWYTSDDGIATVSDGVVTGVSDGEAYITAFVIDKDGHGKSGFYKISVIFEGPEYAKNMEYAIISDNNVSVKAKSGKIITGALTIPSEVDGKWVTGGTEGTKYTVTEIPNSGFANQSGITSLVIPSSVTKIGNSAFGGSYNSQLSSLTLNEGLVEIGGSAFEYAKITSLTLPSTVQKVSGFYNCTKLSDVTLNEGLVEISSNGFYGCPIESVTLPESLETIGSYAFSAGKIKNITIPAKVSKIEYFAFGPANSDLVSATFNDTTTQWNISSGGGTWTPSTDASANATKLKSNVYNTFLKQSE